MFKFLRFKASKITRLYAFGFVFVMIIFAKFYGSNSYDSHNLNGVYEPLGVQVEKITYEFKNAFPKEIFEKQKIEKRWVSVKKVIDGDTFSDVNDNRYRIAFIDAPENKQAFGNESNVFLKTLIENQNVVIENLYKDKYDRIVAKVYFDDVDIAEVLVEFGYAWNQASFYNADKKYAEKLDELEAIAKENKHGLWAFDDIESPFEYRQENKLNENIESGKAIIE